MKIPTPLEEARNGVRFVDAILDLGEKIGRRTDKMRRDTIRRTLRRIYFTPDGVLGLLRRILEGEKISESEWQNRTRDFADAQWEIEKSTARNDFRSLIDNLDLPIEFAETIRNITWNKIHLRNQVMDEITKYRVRFDSEDRDRIENLIAALVSLNQQIARLDEDLKSEPKRQ